VHRVNVVTLIGNLATEVERREVAPDKRVASFVLAVDRASRDGDADFVTVSAWDRQGELCAEFLGRGRQVAIDGRLKSRSWGRGQAAERSRSSPGGSSSSAAGLGVTRRAPEQT
jgi:single-strand DNA-binding protein